MAVKLEAQQLRAARRPNVVRIPKSNQNHEPAGSSIGGRFASGDGSSGGGDAASGASGGSTSTGRDTFATTLDATLAIQQLLDKPNAPVSVRWNAPQALDAATTTHDVLSEMKARGYEMPSAVNIDVVDTNAAGPEGVTDFVTPNADGSGSGLRTQLQILLPATLPPDANLDAAVKSAFGSSDQAPNAFAVSNMRDIVIHEMGHIQAGLRDSKVGIDGFSSLADQHAALTVSLYASTNVNEFMAESFTRLYRGESLQLHAQALYDRLDGPKVK